MKVENIFVNYSRAKGFILVTIAAVLWGISGTVAQYLFHIHHYSPEWLVVVRLICAGLLLLLLAIRTNGKKIWDIWKEREDRKQLLLFGILGMLGVQYTYFAAIDHGNAATATVLQYLAPIIVTCYLAFKGKRLPFPKEILAVILATLGTFLLASKGSLNRLAISEWALFWGIASAFALAFYTLQPLKLLKKWGSFIVVGWGMTIGGVGFSFLNPPWKFVGDTSISSHFALIFIIIFGTVIPFYCYLESMRYIKANEASLFASLEPLSAVFVSVIWLHVPFGLPEWFGTLFIIGTMVLLTTNKEEEKSYS